MKYFQNLIVLTVFSCILYSCSASRRPSGDNSKPRKSTLTGVTPGIKNPTRSVINASGDGLTPGIGNTNGAGSEENATNIANNAISRVNTMTRGPQMRFDSLSNEDFLNKSAVSGMMEIKMSRIAQQKTNNKKVKEYATVILNDYQELQSELKKLSSIKHINFPDSIPSGLQLIKASAKEIDGLSKADQSNLDYQYVQMIIKDHRYVIQLFEAGIGSKDPAIRAFATKYLPMLKQHLLEAQALTTEVGPKQKQ